MKKFYFLFILLIFQSVFPQIKNDAESLSTPNYFCEGQIFSLSVDDYLSNSSNLITKEEYSAYSSYFVSTGENDFEFLNSSRDDVFSKAVELDFDFNYFGQRYRWLAIGTNGRIVLGNDGNEAFLQLLFDNLNYVDRPFASLGNPNNYKKLNSASYNEVYKTADVTRKLQLAQIFAGYTASRGASTSSNYKYRQFNDGTNKGIAITFQNIIPYNQDTTGAFGSSSVFTSRVLLFDDGRIVITVFDKVYFRYNAIIGLQNEDASEFVIAPRTDSFDYNNSFWPIERSLATGNPISLIFKTGVKRTPHYSWKVNGTEVSTTRFFTPNYTPSDNDKVEVDITFDELGVEPIHSEVIFKKIKNPTITKTINGCNIDLNVDNSTLNSGFVYKWFRDTTELGETGSILSLNSTSLPGSYFVKVYKPDGTTACNYESNKIEIKSFFQGLKKDRLTFCDNSTSPPTSKTVNLFNEFSPKYNSSLNTEEYEIEYFEGGELISDPANYSLQANKEVAISVKRKFPGTTTYCTSDDVKLNFITAKPTEGISVCSSVTSFALKDYFEAKFPNTVYNFSYVYTDGNLVTDANAVDVAKNVKVTVSKNPSDCSVSTVFSFVRGSAPSVPPVPLQERCSGSKTSNTERFDFNELKNLLDPTNQYDVKFFRKSDNSEITEGSYDDHSDLNSAGYFWTDKKGDYIIYAKLYNTSNPTCFGSSQDITLRVYDKPRLLKKQIDLFNCPGNNIYNISQNQSDITSAASGISVKLEYYSETNQLLSNADTTNYDAVKYGDNPYLKVIYNKSCGDTVTFNLKYHPKPVAAATQTTVCDEKTYSGDAFKNLVITNSSQYTFYENDGTTPLRTSFDLAEMPQRINYFIKNNATGCLSDIQTFNFVKGTESQLLKDETNYTPCDTIGDLFDGKTVFNLDSKKTDFTTNTAAVFKYYKDSGYSQEITNPTAYNNSALAETIYVKITLPGYCPTDAKINLKVNTPSKSTTLKDKYFICYGDSILVDGGTENNGFKWSDGQASQLATFANAGSYSVILTNAQGCSYIHNFIISDENQPKIKKINQNEQQIEVIAKGNYPIQYSFDGGLSFQSSNIYPNPIAEQYVIQVRSAMDEENEIYCLGEVRSLYTINISNAISPNGDGFNDYWTIKNLGKMQDVDLKISDRFGKIVYDFSKQNSENNTNSNNNSGSNDPVWDGTYNGRALPTATYWYLVKWFDPSTQKTEQRQGWILLKNR